MTRLARAVLATVAVLVAVAGCSDDPPSNPVTETTGFKITPKTTPTANR